MGDDKISTLPDELLCHMLSFLPTKRAVSTSILSKRWKTLWRSVSTLDFSEESVGFGPKDMQTRQLRLSLAVYSFMLSRDVRQPIKRFRLKCGSGYPLSDPSNVDIWVNTATQCGVVRHLELSLHQNSSLPSCVLTTTTLVVLKLCRLTVNDPSSVSLPSLKTLHLESVHFKHSGFVAELLSGCPILEDLQLKSLYFVKLRRSGEEEFKSLSKLVTADISISDSSSVFYVPLKVLYNVKFLRGNLWSDSNNDIPIFHNLIHLELIFTIHKWNWLLDVLETCPKLQILIIDKVERSSMFNRRDDENWAYPQLVPKCLSSHLRALPIRGYEGSESELRFATYILQNARALQTMKICRPNHSSLSAKLEMIKKLFFIPRSSVTCKLSFY